MELARALHGEAGRQHVAHFYATDTELISRAAEFLLGALRDGGRAIVVAAPAHRRALSARLRAAGFPSGDRWASTDAAKTLDRLVVNGEVDMSAFEHSVGEPVRGAIADGRPVHVYGEMVALLWRRGDVTAVLELERLWDELAERLGIGLFCGYPIAAVDVDGQRDGVLEVCGLHAATYGEADWLPPRELARWFSGGVDAPGAARRFVRAALDRWGAAAAADDAVLVVSELAANAVLHAGTPFTVELRRSGSTVRVGVRDTATTLPIPRQPGDDDRSGRGLQIVRGIATAWGIDRTADGKTVWADLSVPPGHA
jgi:anti-sigma regulatory factor (Ser/Thr protein kinase)